MSAPVTVTFEGDSVVGRLLAAAAEYGRANAAYVDAWEEGKARGLDMSVADPHPCDAEILASNQAEMALKDAARALYDGRRTYDPSAQRVSTSNADAHHLPPVVVGEAVLAVIKASADGMTCDDVESATGLRHQTASARVNELGRLGAIVDSGERRATASGRKAIVWRAA
jgi:hypothetical protein